MKVYILVCGDKTMQTNIDAYESLYEAMVEANNIPCPDPFRSWSRSVDDADNVIWTCGNNWMRLEEMLLIPTKSVQTLSDVID